ncbi:glycosyl transferase, UDP-glucuronosyltransferase [Candidatus Nitrososphaera evergladensis SR1]|uniref:Glycosyl transferase, UDP-glucuronosyltransferase n=1 Tax=Candidatus Nitrososphaera evergladensis SR1 TaxID=1459636 RepID=A0A075MRT9_9ARCH|nr:glycosyl transferase, UDP-glucuronosyltransferase [Candidatus Nitrososphaera evergladensis SR1]
MVDKAYLAPYGVGLGHASRMVMVADHLQQYNDVQVRFSTFGEAAKYVSMRGYQCVNAPPVEFAWSVEGGFSVKHSIANIPIWFTNLVRQVNHETRNMIMYSPDVILSDSRLSPLLAAKLLGIPSIVLLNQVKLLLSPRLREFRISRLFEAMVGEFLGSMWNLADRILVPDLPPPYTVAAHNVWCVGSAARKLEYIGFTAPKPVVTEEQVAKVASDLEIDRSRPVVFVHISGPMETRMPLIKLALEATRLADINNKEGIQFIFSEGRPHGSIEPKRIEHGWYYEWCPVRDEVFALSDLVLMRGGHTALSQAIQFGKPVVTIPIENHGEQLGNSEKIAKLGAGMMVHPKKLKPEKIAEAIEQVLSDPAYRKSVFELKKMTESLDGINNVVKIVRSYL